MLVKSESFREFERMYNVCYGVSYAAHKKCELDRNGRRILKTKEDLINQLNKKGISTERILEFVDSARWGYFSDDKFNFIKEFQYKNVSTDAVLEMINDLGFGRVDLLVGLCSKSTGDISKKLLRKLVFWTGLMSDIRIESYSLFGFSGVYDSWCKNENRVVKACQFFTDLARKYEESFLVKISNVLEKCEDSENELVRKKKEAKILEMIIHGKDSCENYGIDVEEFNLWRLFVAIVDLIDGQCEWFWSQD